VLPVFSADEMRALDQRAIAELGIPGAKLMERAGRAAAEVVVGFLGRRTTGDRRVTIVCGKGGNGGDGFVVARELARRGMKPVVLLAVPPREIGGDAGGKLAALKRAGVRPLVIERDEQATRALADADVIVDGLLGTGTRGAPTGLIARLIDMVNASGRPVIALDIPSGLPADGGAPPGPAVRARLTVTFAGLKRGLVMGPGVDFAGQVRVVPIGIPVAEISRGVRTFVLEAADVARHFPPRSREAHKGTYGHLLIVAGSLGKTGAAALAARAALRSGAGLVTVATPGSQQPVLASLLLEAMTESLPETATHTIALAAADVVAELAESRDAVALGPGLGRDGETAEAVRRLAKDVRRPMVIDADGLTALAEHLDILAGAAGPRCLTPHPGEMARLLGVTTAEVQRDRINAALEIATNRRVHVVLKGATSVLAAPDGTVVLNPTGNPGMASGGTGDVLTGVVGAFLARGMEPGSALQSAVYLHGLAGDVAAARIGQESLVAGDVIEALPGAFADVTREGARKGRAGRDDG
jgi:hydroxyethylthiazole kinase-like uncharacterized protein yjeF